jgi:hypothetical protein
VPPRESGENTSASIFVTFAHDGVHACVSVHEKEAPDLSWCATYSGVVNWDPPNGEVVTARRDANVDSNPSAEPALTPPPPRRFVIAPLTVERRGQFTGAAGTVPTGLAGQFETRTNGAAQDRLVRLTIPFGAGDVSGPKEVSLRKNWAHVDLARLMPRGVNVKGSFEELLAGNTVDAQWLVAHQRGELRVTRVAPDAPESDERLRESLRAVQVHVPLPGAHRP